MEGQTGVAVSIERGITLCKPFNREFTSVLQSRNGSFLYLLLISSADAKGANVANGLESPRSGFEWGAVTGQVQKGGRSVKHLTRLTSVCAIAVLLFSLSCGPSNTGGSGSAGTGVIKIDGSSTVFPLTEAVAEEFQKAKQGKVKVTVGISGTGGGFKKFVRGELDISDASRPILKEEMDQAKANGIEYIELPSLFRRADGCGQPAE